MPKFLLTSIFILIVLGQIFAVKDYTVVEPENDVILLEDLYFNEKYVDIDKAIQIIEIPQEGKKEIIITDDLEKNTKNCVYFNYKGIPYIDFCDSSINQDIFSTDF